MDCKFCKKSIQSERLKALPNVKTCVDCSDEQAYVGFQMYGHKTAGFLAYAKPGRTEEEQERFRRLKREYNRGR